MTQSQFWDRLADRYSKRAIDDIPAYEATMAHVQTFLSDTDHVLEEGCGTGGTARLLAPYVSHLTATDFSAKMIEIAEMRLRDDPQANLIHRAAPAGAMLDAAPFDVICNFNLLHLVPSYTNLMASVYDRLKPGGLFLSKTPCLKERSPLFRLVIPVARLLGKAPYVAFVDAADLENALRAAGFEIIDSRGFGSTGSSRFIAARKP